MEFIETRIFTQAIVGLITEEELARLQLALFMKPDAGKLIPGTGGLRKLRWVSGSKGKRGGVRVIYYWYVPREQIYLLLAYKKSAQDDLTKNQLKILAKLVKEETK